jgi:hypothetical protein
VTAVTAGRPAKAHHPSNADTAQSELMETVMLKSNSKLLALANIVLAAIPLIGMFALGYAGSAPVA